ncbi:hypothetical protein [Novosphingobium sp. SCN 63-17]|uniref:hypothetical protein n=1 Tax=Novosphingobium sp. SCN 63-17 TaxID=1660120 RepID=UPI00086B733F|nr:hypothetical protein [Novosphingobium sp. SCN 63-17]ODU81650.1 MAG: hypothetical protein ABT10_13505 [Novosphingobium sp. SCN 63-17]
MTDLKDTLAALSEAEESEPTLQNKMNFAFTCASAYRSGQLVPVPSVEVVARAMAEASDFLWDAMPNTPDAACGYGMPEGCRDYWRHRAPIVIAAMKGEGEGNE